MKRDTTIWQREGTLVYKLRESGTFSRDKETKELRPDLENMLSFNIQGAVSEPDREAFADRLTKLLNRPEAAPDFPVLEAMTPFPPNCNPFRHDAYHMGADVSGPWLAMFSGHHGLKQDHTLTDEEKLRRQAGEKIWNDDPEYIILVNAKTGQRFRIVFPEVVRQRAERLQTQLAEIQTEESQGE